MHVLVYMPCTPEDPVGRGLPPGMGDASKVGKTRARPARHGQDTGKTPARHAQDPQDTRKTPARHAQDTRKTPARHARDTPYTRKYTRHTIHPARQLQDPEDTPHKAQCMHTPAQTAGHPQDDSKTPARHTQDTHKTPARHPQDARRQTHNMPQVHFWNLLLMRP